MCAKITRQEALKYVERWRRVNASERAELRQTTLDRKLLQVAALMASVAAMGWSQALAEEDKPVRERWLRIREFFRE